MSRSQVLRRTEVDLEEWAPRRILEALPAICPHRGPFTAADLDAVGTLREGCELVDGHLLATTRPSLVHQAVAGELRRRLTAWAGRCSAFVLGAEPFTVALGEHAVVAPDVAVALRSRHRPAGSRFEGAPELLVEVLDRGDARRERELKVRIYAEAGVREYWIADPAARTLDFLVLSGGRYTLCLPEDGVHRSRSLPGLVFDAADLWWDAEQLLPLGF
jgi:Uma2 family endonuclease